MRYITCYFRMNYFGDSGHDLFGYWRGDKNTKYFHQRASQQRRKNHIHGFMDEIGWWSTSESDIDRVAKSYFQNFFTLSNPTNLEGVLDSVDKVVTPNMNHTLLQSYTLDEVKRTLFNM